MYVVKRPARTADRSLPTAASRSATDAARRRKAGPDTKERPARKGWKRAPVDEAASFGRAVRAEREWLRLTLEQVAERARIPADKLLAAEQGEALLSLSAQNRLAGVLRLRFLWPGTAGNPRGRLPADQVCTAPDPRAAAVGAYLRASLKSVRRNAERRGLPYVLGEADLEHMVARAGGRCEVTGIRFSMRRFGTPRAPFAPSIDRIDCSLGYAPGNVRLVCQIANLAMNEWGDDALIRLIRDARLPMRPR